MQIQKATKKDLKEITKQIQHEFPYALATRQKIRKRFHDRQAMIFCAKENNEIAGFIDISFEAGLASINGFSVKEKFRKRGLGTKLLVFAMQLLKELGAVKIKLFVKQKNSVAKKMYEKIGFRFLQMHPKKFGGEPVEEMIFEETDWVKKIYEKIVQ